MFKETLLVGSRVIRGRRVELDEIDIRRIQDLSSYTPIDSVQFRDAYIQSCRLYVSLLLLLAVDSPQWGVLCSTRSGYHLPLNV